MGVVPPVALGGRARQAARVDRRQSDRSLGAYEVYTAAASWAEPEWPDLPLKEVLRLAFRDKHITTANHPVLKRLRGEA